MNPASHAWIGCLLFALGGCAARPSPRHEHATLASRPPASSTSASPTPPTISVNACARFAHENEAAFAAARLTDDAREHWRETLPEDFAHCTRDGAGAWGFLLERIVVAEGDAAPEARWSIVHDDGHGHRAAWAPRFSLDDASGAAVAANGTNYSFDTYANGTLVLDPPVLFDFDGDGNSEAFVHAELSAPHVAQSIAGWMLTLRGASIERYAAVGETVIERVEDGDHDGRPDLVSPGPYVAVVGSGTEEHDDYASRITGPEFLVRSHADGTFSWTDPACVEFARNSCGERTATVTTPTQAVCLRVFGATAQEAARVIQRSCRRPERCEQLDTMRQWAAIDPPVLASAGLAPALQVPVTLGVEPARPR